MDYTLPHGHILDCSAEGRVENNNIMCAYHAWSFSSEGNLVDVPQAHHSGDPEGNARACASRRGCVATYPVMVNSAACHWVITCTTVIRTYAPSTFEAQLCCQCIVGWRCCTC